MIGANMSLTGYGGGIERKRWLLAHEGVILDTGPLAPLAPSPRVPWRDGRLPRRGPPAAVA